MSQTPYQSSDLLSPFYDPNSNPESFTYPSSEIDPSLQYPSSPGIGSSHQSTVDTNYPLDTDFLRPSIPLEGLPLSLTRVGPNRRKNWILYNDMNKKDFVQCWLKTYYRQE